MPLKNPQGLLADQTTVTPKQTGRPTIAFVRLLIIKIFENRSVLFHNSLLWWFPKDSNMKNECMHIKVQFRWNRISAFHNWFAIYYYCRCLHAVLIETVSRKDQSWHWGEMKEWKGIIFSQQDYSVSNPQIKWNNSDILEIDTLFLLLMKAIGLCP